MDFLHVMLTISRAKGHTVLYWCHGASQQPLLTVSAASGLGQEKLIIEELVKLDVVVIC